MSETTDLMAARATAGTAYASAVTAFFDAWIELHAIELALQNSRFKTANTPGIGLYTAGPDSVAMRHVEFTPVLTNPGEPAFALADRVTARASEIIEAGGVA